MSKLIDRSYLVGKRIQNVIVNSWSSGNCDVTCVCGHSFTAPTRWLTSNRETRVRCPKCSSKSCPTQRSYRAMVRRGRKRGVYVCPEWGSFDAFVADMGLRPVGTVIDRIDNAKGYFKANCRWASYKLSTENRSVTKWLTVGGKQLRVDEAAKIYGVSATAIYQRLMYGWSDEKAATTPLRKKIKRAEKLGHKVHVVRSMEEFLRL